jgi:hypothetical protein
VDLRPSDVIPAVFPRCHEEVLSAVRSIAREIPPLLEESGGPGAELAVDVIPDAAGKPWLLEVNSKPSSLFLNTDSIRLRNITIERILDYALSIRCTS